ncbi:MAG: CmcI family methyltransferase, partial [Thermoprotei archaeon]
MIKQGLYTLRTKGLQYTIKAGLHYCIIPIIFKKLSKRILDLNEAVDFAFNFHYFGVSIRPAQVKDEILGLLKLIKDLNPRRVLEIGTARGGTLFLFTRVANSDAMIISVDLPGGMFGGGYPAWKIPLYKSFAIHDQKIYLIRADSHDPITLNRVKEILNSKNIDFLFIDGDHTSGMRLKINLII